MNRIKNSAFMKLFSYEDKQIKVNKNKKNMSSDRMNCAVNLSRQLQKGMERDRDWEKSLVCS